MLGRQLRKDLGANLGLHCVEGGLRGANKSRHPCFLEDPMFGSFEGLALLSHPSYGPRCQNGISVDLNVVLNLT